MCSANEKNSIASYKSNSTLSIGFQLKRWSVAKRWTTNRHFWPLIIKQYAESVRVKATDKKDSLSP